MAKRKLKSTSPHPNKKRNTRKDDSTFTERTQMNDTPKEYAEIFKEYKIRELKIMVEPMSDALLSMICDAAKFDEDVLKGLYKSINKSDLNNSSIGSAKRERRVRNKSNNDNIKTITTDTKKTLLSHILNGTKRKSGGRVKDSIEHEPKKRNSKSSGDRELSEAPSTEKKKRTRRSRQSRLSSSDVVGGEEEGDGGEDADVDSVNDALLREVLDNLGEFSLTQKDGVLVVSVRMSTEGFLASEMTVHEVNMSIRITGSRSQDAKVLFFFRKLQLPPFVLPSQLACYYKQGEMIIEAPLKQEHQHLQLPAHLQQQQPQSINTNISYVSETPPDDPPDQPHDAAAAAAAAAAASTTATTATTAATAATASHNNNNNNNNGDVNSNTHDGPVCVEEGTDHSVVTNGGRVDDVTASVNATCNTSNQNNPTLPTSTVPYDVCATSKHPPFTTTTTTTTNTATTTNNTTTTSTTTNNTTSHNGMDHSSSDNSDPVASGKGHDDDTCGTPSPNNKSTTTSLTTSPTLTNTYHPIINCNTPILSSTTTTTISSSSSSATFESSASPSNGTRSTTTTTTTTPSGTPLNNSNNTRFSVLPDETLMYSSQKSPSKEGEQLLKNVVRVVEVAGKEYISVVVDVGKLFKPSEIHIRVKEDRMIVVHCRTEGSDEANKSSFSAVLERRFELDKQIDRSSLKAGCSGEGLLKIFAKIADGTEAGAGVVSEGGTDAPSSGADGSQDSFGGGGGGGVVAGGGGGVGGDKECGINNGDVGSEKDAVVQKDEVNNGIEGRNIGKENIFGN